MNLGAISELVRQRDEAMLRCVELAIALDREQRLTAELSDEVVQLRSRLAAALGHEVG